MKRTLLSNLFVVNKSVLTTKKFVFPSIIESSSSYIRNFSSSLCNFESTNTTTTSTETTTTLEQPRGRLFFITLVKSPHHQTTDVQQSINALKLKKIHQLQVHKDTPQIRGLIYKCRFLLSVKSVSTADIFPEGTQHLPQHTRLTMKEIHQLKLKAMREKKSLHKLIEDYTATKKQQQQ
ncbi:hypothetical protein ABK040_013849 [Willaertia magna]